MYSKDMSQNVHSSTIQSNLHTRRYPMAELSQWSNRDGCNRNLEVGGGQRAKLLQESCSQDNSSGRRNCPGIRAWWWEKRQRGEVWASVVPLENGQAISPTAEWSRTRARWEMKPHELRWQIAHGFMCQAKCLRVCSQAMWSHCQISNWYIHFLSGNDTALDVEAIASGVRGDWGRRAQHGELWSQIGGWLTMNWGL